MSMAFIIYIFLWINKANDLFRKFNFFGTAEAKAENGGKKNNMANFQWLDFLLYPGC